MTNRPGLVKAHPRTTLSKKTRFFVRAVEGQLRAWIEQADVISEGEVKGDRYFGSTSILLRWHAAPNGVAHDLELGRALLSDPHIRLRAIRIARREAESRAGGELLSVSADLHAVFDVRGVYFTIDVEAPTSRSRRGALHS